jgi:hypothetical protein
MKIQISESQLRHIISEQTSLSTGVQSGTYNGTTSYQYDNKSPNIPNNPPPECTKFFNERSLKKVTDWWKNWLNDPITRKKFANAWNFNEKQVNDYYKDYFDVLNNLKLNFSNWMPSSAGGGAKPHLVWIEGYKIHINIKHCKSYTKDTAEQMLVHEIQHYIFSKKPLYPSGEIAKDFNYNKLNKPNLSDRPNLLGEFNVEKRLTEMRFEPESIEKYKKILKEFDFNSIGIDFLNMGTKNDIYLKSQTELYSRLMGVRYRLELKPGQEMDRYHISALALYDQDPNVVYFIICLIMSGRPIDSILRDINHYYASNMNKLEKTNTNPNLPNTNDQA